MLKKNNIRVKKMNIIFLMKQTLFLITLLVTSLSIAFAQENIYGNFPVTEKSYSGSKKDSTSYTGQMARHILHNSLKKLAGKGNW